MAASDTGHAAQEAQLDSFRRMSEAEKVLHAMAMAEMTRAITMAGIRAELEWARASESDRQVDDAVAVLEVNRERLDLGYLRRWASELGVGDLLEHAPEEAGVG